MTRAGDYPPAPKKALRATEVVGQKRQDRHGDSRIFAAGSRPSESRTRPNRRNQDLLAPVLRQGVQPVPAGTALYARPGSRLARQARGVLAPAFELSVGMEIEGKTLGVVGLGKLGSKVSGLAKAFGMNVIAWSPNLTPERCKEVGVGYATKEELFSTADIVTIHVVLSQRSRGLVGASELARMKPTSYLVNTARGPIVDEAALLQTLQQKKIAGAAVDVFSVEPLPVDHPFRKLDNIVLTPHLGYVTEEGFRNHYSQMVEGIDAWFKGEPLRRLA